jgi:hypothetical protein
MMWFWGFQHHRRRMETGDIDTGLQAVLPSRVMMNSEPIPS